MNKMAVSVQRKLMNDFDLDPGLAEDPPKGILGGIVLLLLLVLIVWIVYEETNFHNPCEENEKYIHSQTEYFICEKSDGSLIRR